MSSAGRLVNMSTRAQSTKTQAHVLACLQVVVSSASCQRTSQSTYKKEGSFYIIPANCLCHSALATAISSKPSYQYGDRGGRCPPMTVSLSYGFFLSFIVSRFEIVTLRFPVRGSSGRIELDPSCRTDHSTI